MSDRQYVALDLLLRRYVKDATSSEQAQQAIVRLAGDSPHIIPRISVTRLYDSLRSASSQPPFRLAFSRKEGFVIRYDFLHPRLEGCPLTVAASSFLEPLAGVASLPKNKQITPSAILDLAS